MMNHRNHKNLILTPVLVVALLLATWPVAAQTGAGAG